MPACIRCGTPLPQYTVLCTRCGANQYQFRVTPRGRFWAVLVALALAVALASLDQLRQDQPGLQSPAPHLHAPRPHP
jgi:predicted nucleic acid-binding Zn ribbon protein